MPTYFLYQLPIFYDIQICICHAHVHKHDFILNLLYLNLNTTHAYIAWYLNTPVEYILYSCSDYVYLPTFYFIFICDILDAFNNNGNYYAFANYCMDLCTYFWKSILWIHLYKRWRYQFYYLVAVCTIDISAYYASHTL